MTTNINTMPIQPRWTAEDALRIEGLDSSPTSFDYDPALKLTRTQTILCSASHYDFRYRIETAAE